MQGAKTLAVTISGEPTKVRPFGQTNRVVRVVLLGAYIILAKRDALVGQKAFGDASIWTGPVADESFDNTV
jgi:hypothetical protein